MNEYQTPEQQIAALPALFLPGNLEGVDWQMHDDLCDCVFQRIGEWRNPYIGKTMRVRLCCMWEKLNELFPGLVQMLPGYFDENRGEFVEGVIEWDSPEDDMPRAIWYRQIATVTGKTLAEVRAEYSDREPPRARFSPGQLAAFVRAEQLAAEDEAALEEGY